jgi:hypothetical protein
MEGKLIKVESDYRLLGNSNSIIGTTDLEYQQAFSDVCNKLSLKNCEAVVNGYDLDELAKKHYDVHIKQGHTKEDSLQRKIDFILGFKKALEILGDKKFSEKDMRRALSAGLSIGSIKHIELVIANKQIEINSCMKSLQQTEWDVEVVIECGEVKQCECSSNENCLNPQPKLDANGCLILKRI